MTPSRPSTEPSALRRLTAFAPLLAALFCAAHATPAAHAQAKQEAEKPSIFCDQTRALLLVGEQLSEAKMFENPVKRIAIMVSGADLLWPHREEQARAIFAEAFELASAHFREKGDEWRRDKGRPDSKLPGLTIQLPDQRFVVLRVVARRDAAWARRLAERAAEETRRDAEKKRASSFDRMVTAQKLLSLAETLLQSDLPTALSIARLSFGGEASSFLPRFLYRLAEVDRDAADKLYRDALNAYAGRETKSLLHLSTYPFALRIGIGPVSGAYAVPQGFGANPVLQRQYVAALLQRVVGRLAAFEKMPPPDESVTGRSEAELIYAALLVLESVYVSRDAAESARITELKTQAAALLNADRQRRAATYSQREFAESLKRERVDNFDETFENAQRHADPERRDQMTMMAVVSAVPGVSLEKLENAVHKVNDVETRRQLSNWLYFTRSQRALKDGELDEATRLAGRVGALDEGALLYLEIAAEGLKRFADRQRADEILGGVYKAAQKAPETEAKARALLGIAHLYAKLDYLRGAEVLSEAMKTVNLLTEPDFSGAVLHRMLQGKTFSMYTVHPVPGFNLENAFRELGPYDFEGALDIACKLDDKHLRAIAVNALSARCLEESQPPPKPGKQAPPSRKSAEEEKQPEKQGARKSEKPQPPKTQPQRAQP